MAKRKPNQKRRKPARTENVPGFDLKPSGYQPSKADMEEDISVPVSMERLAQSALSGGAERRGTPQQ